MFIEHLLCNKYEILDSGDRTEVPAMGKLKFQWGGEQTNIKCLVEINAQENKSSGVRR